jgi:hypothetical protein
MLAGKADDGLNISAAPRAFQHHGGHFDGFRTGAKNQEWAKHGHVWEIDIVQTVVG